MTYDWIETNIQQGWKTLKWVPQFNCFVGSEGEYETLILADAVKDEDETVEDVHHARAILKRLDIRERQRHGDLPPDNELPIEFLTGALLFL